MPLETAMDLAARMDRMVQKVRKLRGDEVKLGWMVVKSVNVGRFGMG